MASASENQADDDKQTKQTAGKYREISDEKLKGSINPSRANAKEVERFSSKQGIMFRSLGNSLIGGSA